MEITAETVAFAIFAVFTLGGALGVVTMRNLFHAALMLILSLFGVAGLYILLTAPFLAAVQIMLYVAAVAILIIIAIMLTRSLMKAPIAANKQWEVSALIALIVLVSLVAVILQVSGGRVRSYWPQEPVGDVPADSITALGASLVDPDRYVLPFEVASVLILAAMIGAIVIVRSRPTS